MAEEQEIQAAELALLENIRAALDRLTAWIEGQAEPLAVAPAITGAAPGGTIADVLGPIGAPGVTRPAQAVATARYPTIITRQTHQMVAADTPLLEEAFLVPANGTVTVMALPATGTTLALSLTVDGVTYGQWTPTLTAGEWNGPFTMPVAKADQVNWTVTAGGELTALRIWFQAD